MRRLATRVSYANVVSTLALFLALGGSAGAAAVITSRDVRDGSLTSRDVKDHSLRAADLRASDLPAGPRGPAGEDGDDGEDGMDGMDGMDGADGEDGARGPAGQDAVRVWAVVGSGVLVRGKGVVSVTPGGTGMHTIRFDRDVSACAYGAVVLGTNGMYTTTVTASVTTGLTLGGNDRVAVRTESAGTPVDARVSVSVAC
jgi:hypothetical protein